MGVQAYAHKRKRTAVIKIPPEGKMRHREADGTSKVVDLTSDGESEGDVNPFDPVGDRKLTPDATDSQKRQRELSGSGDDATPDVPNGQKRRRESSGSGDENPSRRMRCFRAQRVDPERLRPMLRAVHAFATEADDGTITACANPGTLLTLQTEVDNVLRMYNLRPIRSTLSE